MNGGRNIDSKVRKSVAEKKVEPMPRIQKKVLCVLEGVLIILRLCSRV